MRALLILLSITIVFANGVVGYALYQTSTKKVWHIKLGSAPPIVVTTEAMGK